MAAEESWEAAASNTMSMTGWGRLTQRLDI
jgi:hypothetical protein